MPYEPTPDEKRVIAWLEREHAKAIEDMKRHQFRSDNSSFNAFVFAAIRAQAAGSIVEAIEQGHHHDPQD